MSQNNDSQHSSFFMKEILIISANILSFFSLTIEVLIRGRMGERYLHFIDVLFLGGFALFLNKAPLPMLEPADGVASFFVAFSAFIAFIRIFVSTFMSSGKEILHSRYDGRPLLFRKFGDKFAKSYLEPAVIFGIGLLLFLLFDNRETAELIVDAGGREFRNLHYIFMVFGVSMFLKSQIRYRIHRNQFLDEQDSRIEQGALKRAFDGENVREQDNFGYSIPGNVPNAESREKLKDMYDSLNPSLQKIMENEAEFAKDVEVEKENTGRSEPQPNRENDTEREI